jgi:protein-disulfide isomerase
MTNRDATSKNARRQSARETARAWREDERRRQRRNRIVIQGGIGAAVLAAVVIIVLVVNTSSRSATPIASTDAGPKNMATDGIVFHGVSGTVEPVSTAGIPAKSTPSPVATSDADRSAKVISYIDWACPVCKQFEDTYSTQILDLVAQGKATLEVHPVAILDRNFQNSRFASRAANAAACVANYDPSQFLAVQTEFYDNQPAEGTTGLTNSQIKALIVKAGVDDPRLASCVDNESFKSWVTATTSRAVADASLVSPSAQGFGTPTVLVDGKVWDNSTKLMTLIDRG